MEFIQHEINTHKNKLMNLINNLNNTQLINEEIFINNEIKKESECLISLLNIKYNTLNSQNNINNNINFNPFMFQQNPVMNVQNININPIKQQIYPEHLNIHGSYNDNNDIINVKFEHMYGKKTVLVCRINEKFSDVVKKYREKANDYENNLFLFDGSGLDPSSNLTLAQLKLLGNSFITVLNKEGLKGG